MSQATAFISRLGRFFHVTQPVMRSVPEDAPAMDPAPSSRSIEPVRTRRLGFLRPWARRDAAINSLQRGFDSLTDLMTTIRENLERADQRQEEMMNHLAHLPQILESLPESHRIHGETLRSIGQQIQQQVEQQSRLTEILDRVGRSSADQHELLESLHHQAQTVAEHNKLICANLRQVGSAMENVGRTTQSSAQLLEQFREKQADRDHHFHRLIQRQGMRLTIMLAVTIALSLAALGTAGVSGFIMLKRMQSERTAPPAPALAEAPPALSSAAAVATTDAAPAAMEILGPPAPQTDVLPDAAVTTTNE